jgi:hypothetical protein
VPWSLGSLAEARRPVDRRESGLRRTGALKGGVETVAEGLDGEEWLEDAN